MQQAPCQLCSSAEGACRHSAEAASDQVGSWVTPHWLLCLGPQCQLLCVGCCRCKHVPCVRVFWEERVLLAVSRYAHRRARPATHREAAGASCLRLVGRAPCWLLVWWFSLHLRVRKDGCAVPACRFLAVHAHACLLLACVFCVVWCGISCLYCPSAGGGRGLVAFQHDGSVIQLQIDLSATTTVALLARRGWMACHAPATAS